MNNKFCRIVLIEIILFSICTISFAQTNEYVKNTLFTLDWGDNTDQIGLKIDHEYYIYYKLGPYIYTVTPNNKFCIYDYVHNAIKVFDSNGKLVGSYTFTEAEKIPRFEGYINSDHENNIWFHDGTNRRIIVFNDNCKMEYSIKYESKTIFGGFYIRNGKPVFDVLKKALNINKTPSAERYADMPVYNAELIDIDEKSILYQRRGVKTNRLYKVESLDVSDEGDIVLPRLIIDNNIVEYFDVNESIIKKYVFDFIREDNYGNFYIYFSPSYDYRNNPEYLFKYNEDLKKVATIELPIPSQHFEYACSPVIIDDYGNIFYMMLRDENITFLKWTIK